MVVSIDTPPQPEGDSSMSVRGLKMRLIAGSVVALLAIGCGETDQATPQPAASATTAATRSEATTAAAAPQPAAEVSDDAAGSDVTGAYFATTPLPAEFAELDHLLLATIDENGAPAPLNGFLRPKKASAKDYVLVQPALSGRNLTFTTAAVNGVHYAFTGAFTRLDNFAANPPEHDAVVLSGTLTKMRDGNSVATTPVSFGYQAGG
jgi:hypothetical protein